MKILLAFFFFSCRCHLESSFFCKEWLPKCELIASQIYISWPVFTHSLCFACQLYSRDVYYVLQVTSFHRFILSVLFGSFTHLSVFLDQRSSQSRELWKKLRAVTLKGRIHESNISQIPTFENTQWRKAAQTEFMRAISVKWSAALNSNSLAHPNIRSCYSNFQNNFKFQTFLNKNQPTGPPQHQNMLVNF